jgi:uncharacterized Zn finger protein (UPF0148 family)
VEKDKGPSPLFDEKIGLICPHCKAPLLIEETIDGKFRCSICDKFVGRLSVEVMIKMVEVFPSELLREWEIEMSVV